MVSKLNSKLIPREPKLHFVCILGFSITLGKFKAYHLVIYLRTLLHVLHILLVSPKNRKCAWIKKVPPVNIQSVTGRDLEITEEVFIMNYSQNQRISQITESTLIVGVDIAKHKHVARAQNDRGLMYGKAFSFSIQECSSLDPSHSARSGSKVLSTL
jgi:hypothetical protein